MESPFTERDEYQATGRVGFEFIVAAIPLACVAALLTGAALFGVWRLGLYFVVLMPLAASIPVAAAAGCGVRIGKCRNRRVAAAYGILAGALMYGSYFYFDMLSTWGADKLLCVDLVPAHIGFRMQTDRLEVHPGIGKQNNPPSPWLMNFFFFSIDAVLICAVTCIPGVALARGVFCERSRRWARIRILPLEPGMGEPIYSALATGCLEECLAGLHVIPLRIHQPYCELVLEECSEVGEADDCCAYISLREYSGGGKSKWVAHYCGFDRFLMRQHELTSEELGQFRKHFADDEPLPTPKPSIIAMPALPAMPQIRRRLTPYVLAAVLIGAGALMMLIPGEVLSTQSKIAKGEADLPRLFVQLIDWCFTYFNVVQPAAFLSGAALILGGLVTIKVNVSHALAIALAPLTSVDVEVPPAVTANKVEVAPPWVRERLVEASPERLVLHLPAAGMGAAIFFWLALAWFVLTGAGCAWAVSEIWQGANADEFIFPGLPMVVGSIAALWFAVKLKFERTFLLLDRERLVVQHVLLGIKRRSETILVPSSRAELIAPQERGLSLAGVQVLGKNGTARFGNKLAPQDCRWLAGKINAFLQENNQMAEAAERAGVLYPEEVARDGAVRVDTFSADVVGFHYLARQDFPQRTLRAAGSLFLVAVCVMVFVQFLRFPLMWRIMPQEALLFAIAISGLALGTMLYIWIAAFGRIGVLVTRDTLTRRYQIFGVDIAGRQSAATETIVDVRVEFGAGTNGAATSLSRMLGALFKAMRPPAEYWSVICAGDQPIVLPGFLSDADARQAAALIVSHIRKWHPAG